MARFLASGYSVVETNHVAAVRTGQIKAQYPMSTALKAVGAQNGQLLTVNDVTKEVGLPGSANVMVYLHASEERMYENHLGRNAFIVKDPNYPRMLKLSVGDIFETNAVDLGAFLTVAAAQDAATGATVGVPSTSGDIKLLASAAGTELVVLNIVEWVTLPNGEVGIKFAVAKA